MSTEKKQWAFLSKSKSMGDVAIYGSEIRCDNCGVFNLVVIVKGTLVSFVRKQVHCLNCGCCTNGRKGGKQYVR